ncbi:MAG: Rieske (2Fe-2S) protein [Planctomycetaceae bacterium]
MTLNLGCLMGRFVPIAKVAALESQPAIEVVIEGRIVAVYRVDGEYVAIEGICPHAGGPLGAGTLVGTTVTCPWHGWQFDVTTGRHCLSDRIQQATYVVRVDGDDICVELP